MKVVITGAAGVVGSYLVKHLAALASIKSIVAFDNLSTGSFDYLFSSFDGKSKVKPCIGDILNAKLLRAVAADADVFIHAATIKKALDMQQLDQVNGWGTADVVAAFEQSSASQFIFISDVAVLGADGQLSPRSPYEWSIARAESHVDRLVKNGKASIVRVGEVCGIAPAGSSHTSVNAMVLAAFAGAKLSIFGDGSLIRNITHVNSVAAVVAGIIESRPIPTSINMVDFSVSSIELFGAIQEVIPSAEAIFMSHHYEEEGAAIAASEGVETYRLSLEETIKEIAKALL